VSVATVTILITLVIVTVTIYLGKFFLLLRYKKFQFFPDIISRSIIYHG
jgi:hypothetical protein